jgi:hypothetical protein
MLSGYIQEYLGYGNFLLGVFGNHSRINFISLLIFPADFERNQNKKNN